MPLPVSRRALLSAVFPFASGEGGNTPSREEQQPPRLVATVAPGICVEGHGVVCRRCAEVCAQSAVRILVRGAQGAVIDNVACTGCGDCVSTCPVEAITLRPRDRVEIVSEFARLITDNG
jgi:ferredoxin-type protein NapF